MDSLPENEMEQVRDALFHTNHPFLMVMVGPFGSGKSSVINALLGAEVLEVGPIPTTDHIVILRHGSDVQRSRAGDIETVFHPSPLLENLSLVDTPGLESVFRTHDEVTRRFLHRADVVLLVMIATQVLTASNLEYLQQLKVFGKRVIIVVNQVDVLEPAEREQVRDFVREQSRQHLGVEPLVWLVSARQALEAQQETPRDEILWDESGFAEIEAYIKETLSDVERFRQKLETPVQVCQNVTKSALELVQEQQAALDTHRKTVENIEAQIEQGRREQQKTVDDALTSHRKHLERSRRARQRRDWRSVPVLARDRLVLQRSERDRRDRAADAPLPGPDARRNRLRAAQSPRNAAPDSRQRWISWGRVSKGAICKILTIWWTTPGRRCRNSRRLSPTR